MDLLIVVDMQNDFIDGVLGTPEAQAIVKKVVQKAMAWNGEVVATSDIHYPRQYVNTVEGQKIPLHCRRGTKGAEIIEILQMYSDRRFIKNTFAPHLISDGYLKMFESFTICGLATNMCVLSTALMLRSRCPEKKIFVDASCCAGTTPELHKEALDVMKSCCIDVIGEEEK